MRRVNRTLAAVSQVVAFAVSATRGRLRQPEIERLQSALEPCGAQGAYVCEGELTSADRDGNTIRSEPVSNKIESRAAGSATANPG